MKVCIPGGARAQRVPECAQGSVVSPIARSNVAG